MNAEKLSHLKIDSSDKQRSRTALNTILVAVTILTAVALFYARPWAKDEDRNLMDSGTTNSPADQAARGAGNESAGPDGARSTLSNSVSAKPGDSVLTVSGYLVNRERIELSPRFMGVVEWIGVKKGDSVTNNQVVVLLDDAEFQAQLKQAEAHLAAAKISVQQAELDYQRAKQLVAGAVEMQKVLDDADLQRQTAHANVQAAEAQIQLIRTYLDWTIIRSPIDGVVLEKMVDPNELVTPQSFGGTRGPSTALISVADPRDLQVEIDLNELDVSKAFLGQRCRVSPEAYPNQFYEGYVAEIAPEANRQKGTLQVKVQIEKPDRYLTPELTARVDFLAPTP